MPQHGLTFGGRGIAGAHRGTNQGCAVASFDRCGPDLGQRYFQIAMNIVRQSLQRRDIDDLGFVGQLAGHSLSKQSVQAPQKGGQRLARTRRSGNQRVLSGGDALPAAALRLGGGADALMEPTLDNRMEERRRVIRRGGEKLGGGHESSPFAGNQRGRARRYGATTHLTGLRGAARSIKRYLHGHREQQVHNRAATGHQRKHEPEFGSAGLGAASAAAEPARSAASHGNAALSASDWPSCDHIRNLRLLSRGRIVERQAALLTAVPAAATTAGAAATTPSASTAIVGACHATGLLLGTFGLALLASLLELFAPLDHLVDVFVERLGLVLLRQGEELIHLLLFAFAPVVAAIKLLADLLALLVGKLIHRLAHLAEQLAAIFARQVLVTHLLAQVHHQSHLRVGAKGVIGPAPPAKNRIALRRGSISCRSYSCSSL